MIAHLATFTFCDVVTAAEVDQLADDLRAMAGSLPSVRRYLDSPAHCELVARSITPWLAIRQALQLELPPEWLGWSDG